MRSTLGGDNLDTPEELAQKGIVPNGGVGLVLGHNRNGSVSLTRFVGCWMWAGDILGTGIVVPMEGMLVTQALVDRCYLGVRRD